MNKTNVNIPAKNRSLFMLCAISMLVALLSAGCLPSALNPGPAPDRIQLHIKNQDVYNKGSMPFQLMVSRPEMGFDLDTDNIALVFDGNFVRYLREANWASPAPQLVQRMIIDNLEASKSLAGIVDESVGIHPRYRLTVHVREFQFNYRNSGSAPAAEVMFNLRLIDTDESVIIATTSIKQSTQASDGSLRSMIQAMESAMSAALDETNAFVISSLEPVNNIQHKGSVNKKRR